MRSNRRARPPVLDRLEPRVVLSQVAAQVSTTFPMSEAATLKHGMPVEDLITTRFADGSVQSEVRLVLPNLLNNTETTVESITLPGGAGVESAVNLGSTQGSTITQNDTTTLPGGATTTEAVTDLQSGATTRYRATTETAGGPVRISGTVTRHGSTTVTNELTYLTDGTISKTHTVAVTNADGSVSTMTQVTPPVGPIVTTNSVSTTQRLQPTVP